MAGSVPSPFIYWGQNNSTVFLRIALRDVQANPDVSTSDNEIKFEGNGVGAHGDSLYKFAITTYKPICPEKAHMRVTGSDILLDVPKREPTSKDEPWPRLTKDSTKYPWIRPDFDKMDVSDDEDIQLLDNERMQKEYLDKLTAEIELTQEQVIEDVKKNYLFSYSLFQLLAMLFILFKVIWGLCRTPDYKAFEDVGTVLIISQIVSILEVVHPLIGLLKTSATPALIQVSGRNFHLLVLIWNNIELQEDIITNYLILCWAVADFIRHPFYMTSVMKIDVYTLLWIRYTSWIVLYPVGALLEWLITYKSIEMFVESGKLSLALPNSLNFSFSITDYLYLHLLILPIALVQLMSHMYSARRKKLGGQKSSSTAKSKKTN